MGKLSAHLGNCLSRFVQGKPPGGTEIFSIPLMLYGRSHTIMSVTMKFPCNACGECCRHVDGVPGLDRGDGICTHFDEVTKLCQVYETRPMACMVDRAFSDLYHDSMSAKVYYMATAVGCTMLHPDNADMPQRTEAALRDAGLFNEEEAIDLQRVQQIVVERITEDASQHLRLAQEGRKGCGLKQI
jgi:Fe-S-cluster containining protein